MTPAARRRAAGEAGCIRPPSPSRRRSRRPARNGAVVLVFYQLRGNLPRSGMTHPGPPILEPGKPGGLPGDPGHLARRPRMLTVVLTGDKRRPSGQGPGARLRSGLASQRGSASRATRSHRRSPAPRPRPPGQPSSPYTGNKPRHGAAATRAAQQPAPPHRILRAARPPRRSGLELRSCHFETLPGRKFLRQRVRDSTRC